MLDYGVQNLEQRVEKRMIVLIGKEKARGRHGSEQLQEF